MTEALDQILLYAGLYWIGELIFVKFLDSDDVLIVAKSDQKRRTIEFEEKSR